MRFLLLICFLIVYKNSYCANWYSFDTLESTKEYKLIVCKKYNSDTILLEKFKAKFYPRTLSMPKYRIFQKACREVWLADSLGMIYSKTYYHNSDSLSSVIKYYSNNKVTRTEYYDKLGFFLRREFPFVVAKGLRFGPCTVQKGPYFFYSKK